MAKSNRPAGGLGSRNVKNVNQRLGSNARGVTPAATGQIGSQLGNHATDSGKILHGARSPLLTSMPAGGGSRLGNAVAGSTTQGPGGSRAAMKSGSQGQHGGVAGSPKPQGRDILSEFGPDSSSVAGRR